MRFIQSRNYTKGRNVPRLIVLHSTEGHERKGEALSVAKWFGGLSVYAAPKASAHFVVDAGEIVQCVLTTDQAWHASKVNAFSVGIEIVGRAAQTSAEWADEYSLATLELVAALISDLSKTLKIPLDFVGADGILAGKAGVTTHFEVTKAFKIKGGHTDPGPHFPMHSLLANAKNV